MMDALFEGTAHPSSSAECTYPLTGVGCVDRIYTDFAVITLGPQGATVLETYGITNSRLAEQLDVPLLDL
jgi:3-oxoadipate CoA-transferase beta subunit